MYDTRYLNHLDNIARDDVAHLKMKEATYRGSWKKRGGIGAFMMLSRKWDRIENMLEQPQTHDRGGVTRTAERYDIFGEIVGNPTGEDGSILAEIRDLRRYLMLVEAEMMQRGDIRPPLGAREPDLFPSPGTPEDGGHHAKS